MLLACTLFNAIIKKPNRERNLVNSKMPRCRKSSMEAAVPKCRRDLKSSRLPMCAIFRISEGDSVQAQPANESGVPGQSVPRMDTGAPTFAQSDASEDNLKHEKLRKNNAKSVCARSGADATEPSCAKPSASGDEPRREG